MYIRQTKIKSGKLGEPYYTYRIVESIREGKKVKQVTLLNLGKNFEIEKEHWPALISRIDQLLQSDQQTHLFDLQKPLDESLEAAAQRYAALIIHKQSQPISIESNDSTTELHDYQMVDINHLEALKPRSIGAETLAYHALTQLQLDKKLTALGFNTKDSAAVIGNIIARMVSPGSERYTQNWLENHSGLGELLGHDFATTSLTRLYTTSDQLLKYQNENRAWTQTCLPSERRTGNGSSLDHIVGLSSGTHNQVSTQTTGDPAKLGKHPSNHVPSATTDHFNADTRADSNICSNNDKSRNSAKENL